MSTKKDYFKESSNPLINDYLYSIGNRISESKLKLREETQKLFPDEAAMLTEITEGELLKMLVKISNSKVAVEIGVFTGYSSLNIAEGLPSDGKLFASDISEEFTDVAKKYWKETGLESKIEFHLKSGLEFLSYLEKNNTVVDFAYIDADKVNYIFYYEELLKILRPGGLIVFDNTLWSGRVVQKADDDDHSTKALQELNLLLQKDERVEINQLPLSDGVTIVRKK